MRKGDSVWLEAFGVDNVLFGGNGKPDGNVF